MATIQLNSIGDATIHAGICATKSDSVSSISCAIDNYITKDEFEKHVNPPKPDVDPSTKSTINCNGSSISAVFYENGYKKSTKHIMPDIVDVLVYNDKVVTVKFADKTEEKAVLHPDDKFSVEQGVSICIAKKLASGGAIYNKIVEHALNVKHKNEEAKENKKKEDALRKEKNRADNLKHAECNRKKREREINNTAAAMKLAIMDIVNEIKNSK